MRGIYIALLALTFSASYPVYAQADKPESKVYTQKPTNPASIEISASENRIRVENAPIGALLEIYSVVGIKVKEIEIKLPTSEYTVDIAKGYYIIRIGETVRKVAIR